MNTQHLLAVLEAFAARVPHSEEDIADIFKEMVVEPMKAPFKAYGIDIFWETGQGIDTRLRSVHSFETEENGYVPREVYKDGKPSSLSGFCYHTNGPIWINDESGLREENEYQNLATTRAGKRFPSKVPRGTIFQYYNELPMRTEICMPLHVPTGRELRVAGVLNIESSELVRPTPSAMNFLRRIAKIIASLQVRVMAYQATARGLKQAKESIRDVRIEFDGKSFSDDLSAFIAYSWNTGEDTKVADVVRAWLRSKDIEDLSRQPIVTTGLIDPDLWAQMRRATFAIVNTTDFNRNVMIEWGFFHACGIPIIRLHHEKGDKEQDPFDIEHHARLKIPLVDHDVDKDALEKLLNEALQRLYERNALPGAD